MKIILFILAVIPVLILSIYIYSNDREKEPKLLLLKLFGCGILSSLFIFLFSYLLFEFFPDFKIDLYNFNFIKYFIYSFLLVSFVEEGCKWLSTRFVGYTSKHFDEAYDIIVYSSFVALGFAFVENIMYVFNYGIGAAILRAIISVPGHLSFGIMMGYYMLLAKLSKNKKDYRKYMICSFIFPLLIHGSYDFLLLFNNIYLLVILLILLFIFYIFSYIKIKTVIEIKKKITN